MQCSVRRGSILSLFIFAIYVDDIIHQIRKSGHGLRMFSFVIGCVAVFFSFVLRLTKEDICSNYGHEWDIKFNLVKSQLTAFGINNPTRCTILLIEK